MWKTDPKSFLQITKLQKASEELEYKADHIYTSVSLPEKYTQNEEININKKVKKGFEAIFGRTKWY